MRLQKTAASLCDRHGGRRFSIMTNALRWESESAIHDSIVKKAPALSFRCFDNMRIRLPILAGNNIAALTA